MTLALTNSSTARPALALAAGLLALTLAGCAAGATDADTSSAPESGGSTENDDASAGGDGVDPGAGGNFGTITVESTTYTVVEAVNCEPVQTTDVLTEVFDVIATAQSSDGGDALFFAYVQEQAGEFSTFLDYQGPEGTWSSHPGAAESAVTDEGLYSGASELVDDGGTESIMIEFSFAVPGELVEC